jgi:hypothetical protein
MKIENKDKTTKYLEAIIEIVNIAIPNKIRAFYLTGSYAENYSINTSDLDGLILLKKSSTKEDIQKAAKILDNLSQISNKDLDISILNETKITNPKSPHDTIDSLIVLQNSKLIYGKDIKFKIPEIDFEAYFETRINEPLYFIKRVRKVKFLKYPLKYPNLKDFYLGYCNRKLLVQGEEVLSSKELVVNVGWIATALIVLKSGEMVVRKNDCLPKYKKYIGDEWVEFLESIFLICRNKWKYLLPEKIEDKNKLRDLCLKALDFENKFLETYKDFLIKKLDESRLEKLFVIDILSKNLHYNDDILIKKLINLKKSGDKQLKEKLKELFLKYKIKTPG